MHDEESNFTVPVSFKILYVIILYRKISQLNSFLKRKQVPVNIFHFAFMLDFVS